MIFTHEAAVNTGRNMAQPSASTCSSSDRRVLSPLVRHLSDATMDPDRPTRSPVLSPEHRELVESLQSYIETAILLDICFDVHREASLLHEDGHRITSPEDRSLTMGRMSRMRGSVGCSVSDDVVITCPECSKAMSVKVFAQHLEQHSGGGRNSSRTARKKLAEEAELHDIRTQFSDEDAVDIGGPLMSPPSGDDDDWNLSRKRRRGNSKAKKKRLN